jgi:hypothetical protein
LDGYGPTWKRAEGSTEEENVMAKSPTKRERLAVAARAGSVVHVRMPARVAYDLRAFQKVQATILDRLGCGACCSGHDIIYDLSRDFLVNEAGEIEEVFSGIGLTRG